MTVTTLGRMCPSDGFVHALSAAFAYQASVARQAMDSSSFYAERHATALEELADYVRTLEQADPIFNALWLIQSSRGDSDKFFPGERQAGLLHRLAMGPETPMPATSLVELVGAGIEDMLASQTERFAPGEQAIARVKELETLPVQLEEARSRIAELEVQLAASRDETLSAVQQRDYLRAQVGKGEPAEERQAIKRGPSGKDRRKVDGTTGVYFYKTKDGITYEITWTENGRQRWLRTGPSLDHAIAEREKRTAAPTEVAA